MDMGRQTKIDYTKMRKGRVIRRWTYRETDGTTKVAESRIIVCPKCGKKGEGVVVDPSMVTHTATLVDGYLTYVRVEEACHMAKPKAAK
jgi:hypothetical protein